MKLAILQNSDVMEKNQYRIRIQRPKISKDLLVSFNAQKKGQILLPCVIGDQHLITSSIRVIKEKTVKNVKISREFPCLRPPWGVRGVRRLFFFFWFIMLYFIQIQLICDKTYLFLIHFNPLKPKTMKISRIY